MKKRGIDVAKVKAKTKIKKPIKKTKVKAKKQSKLKVKPKAAAKSQAKIKANSKIMAKANAKSKSKKIDKAKVTTKKSAIGLISPIKDHVLVEMRSEERLTAGGLIIPDTAQISGNKKGVVLAVGKGAFNKKGQIRPLELRVGDLVLFSEYAGSQIEQNGHKFVLLRESDVLGILQE